MLSLLLIRFGLIRLVVLSTGDFNQKIKKQLYGKHKQDAGGHQKETFAKIVSRDDPCQ
jgi:hypothetical protein